MFPIQFFGATQFEFYGATRCYPLPFQQKKDGPLSASCCETSPPRARQWGCTRPAEWGCFCCLPAQGKKRTKFTRVHAGVLESLQWCVSPTQTNSSCICSPAKDIRIPIVINAIYNETGEEKHIFLSKRQSLLNIFLSTQARNTCSRTYPLSPELQPNSSSIC